MRRWEIRILESTDNPGILRTYVRFKFGCHECSLRHFCVLCVNFRLPNEKTRWSFRTKRREKKRHDFSLRHWCDKNLNYSIRVILVYRVLVYTNGAFVDGNSIPSMKNMSKGSRLVDEISMPLRRSPNNLLEGNIEAGIEAKRRDRVSCPLGCLYGRIDFVAYGYSF
jgi:hypothetical protein